MHVFVVTMPAGSYYFIYCNEECYYDHASIKTQFHLNGFHNAPLTLIQYIQTLLNANSKI